MEEIRKKLVDLLKPHMSGLACEDERGSCELGVCSECRARNLADTMISNGVTVQQWIPVTERLPLCGERVLITEGTTVFEAYLSISHKWVRAGIGWLENVTHWTPMPESILKEEHSG